MASIQEIKENIKHFLGEDASFYGIAVLLVAVSSFGLGRASVGQNEAKIELLETPVTTVTEIPQVAGVAVANATATPATAPPVTTEPQLVGSKNGTKYHYLWCPGAQQIKEENKVYFASREEAERLGYTPAANCKGL